MSAVELKTLPWSWYTDPAVLRLERERIFRRSWQYVGHEGDVPEPGSFAARAVGDVPVVLVRDKEDTLRAFLNVCRHRGSLVCEGSGSARRSSVPTTPGRTASTGVSSPPRGEHGGRDPQGRAGARPLRLETWGRLLFVNPDADAETLEEHLDDIPERIAEAGIDLDALRFLQRSESELDCNWKISAENFLECYHCPTAHPGFSAVMDVTPTRISSRRTPRA